MTRQYPSTRVDRATAGKYFAKARRFQQDAEKMMTLAPEFSGNGIAVLCTHAAIAYGDALAILAEERKSKGDHRQAARFLASIIEMKTEEDKIAMRAFQAILDRKDEVSYADDMLDELDAQQMLDRLKKLTAWAEKTYHALRARFGESLF